MTTKLTYKELLEQSITVKPRKVRSQSAVAVLQSSPSDMKNIVQRTRKDGSPSYLVNLRHKENGVPWIFRGTFDSLSEAIAARDQARAAYKSGTSQAAAIVQVTKTEQDSSNLTVADIIEMRLVQGKAVGRSARQVLKYTSDSYFGSLLAADLSVRDVRAYAEFLANGKRKPQTVASYMTPLVYALKWAHNREYDIPLNKVQRAMSTLWEDEKISKSSERNRRPQVAELERILRVVEKNKRQKIPLGKIIMFALYSARRISEICSLRWEDLQEKDCRILVRAMKHPRKKATNHRYCDLTPEALEVIRSMPRTDERIFPFDAKSAGTAFQRHRDKAGIKGLRFHDLRHEAISRLFEMRKTDRFVARISGHEMKGGCLDRYEHVVEVGDKYADWPWLARVINGDF